MEIESNMSIPDDRFPSNGSSTYGPSDAIIAGLLVFGGMALVGALFAVEILVACKSGGCH